MVHGPLTSITKFEMLGGYRPITSHIKFKMLGRLSLNLPHIFEKYTWYMVHGPDSPRSIHGQITHLHLIDL